MKLAGKSNLCVRSGSTALRQVNSLPKEGPGSLKENFSSHQGAHKFQFMLKDAVNGILSKIWSRHC